MIPDLPTLTEELTDKKYGTKTFHVILERDRIDGYCDNVEALLQTIYFILSTERYKYIIYSWDYGIELVDLFGKPMPYVIASLPSRIYDALTQDDRITDVVNYEFERNGKRLHVTFDVITNVGKIPVAYEVDV